MRHIPSTARSWSAFNVYLLIRAVVAFAYALAFSVNIIYQTTVVQLDAAQLILVGTVMEITILLCEIPTGIVADLYSRRLSILIGYSIVGLSFILQAIPTVLMVFLAQIIWSFGYTFTSGALEAWFVDEITLEADGVSPDLSLYFLRASQWSNIGSISGIIVAILLGSMWLPAPLIVSGVLLISLTLILRFIMPETAFQPQPKEERNTWDSMQDILKQGVQVIRRSRLLMLIALITIVGGWYSEGLDRLWTKHLLENFTHPSGEFFTPVVISGGISLIGALIALFSAEMLRRWLPAHTASRSIRIQQIMSGLQVTVMLIFALSGSFWVAVIALISTQLLRELRAVYYAAWLNPQLESSTRATTLSVFSQTDALGQIVGGPLVAFIGTISTIRITLAACATLLLPIIVLYQRALKLQRPDVKVEIVS